MFDIAYECYHDFEYELALPLMRRWAKLEDDALIKVLTDKSYSLDKQGKSYT